MAKKLNGENTKHAPQPLLFLLLLKKTQLWVCPGYPGVVTVFVELPFPLNHTKLQTPLIVD